MLGDDLAVIEDGDLKPSAWRPRVWATSMNLAHIAYSAARPHVNKVELGKRGGWRSNIWTYPGTSSLGSDDPRGLKDHPTVKPTAMLEDAMLDLTNRGDIATRVSR